MALTKISPALFQVSNNITSVTVGGSANTVSLTFDSNGVITGASNNALSVANTQITGLIEAAQIGSANATLVTSGTLPRARLPAGSVLQVVSATKTNAFTTTSLTLVDVTGLSVSITPSSASNKVLVLVDVKGTSQDAVASSGDSGVVLVRGATSLAVSTAGSVNFTGQLSGRLSGSSALTFTASVSYLDSPATTSSTTYKIQSLAGAGTLFINTDANGTVGSVSTITVMEIQG